MGNDTFGINTDVVKSFAIEINDVVKSGVQICIVVGGGNIYRGISGTKTGMDRATGDHMGMLATVMNSLAIQNALEQIGVETRVQSALPISAVCEPYIRRRAKRHMQKGRVVIFAAGTGNPYFTTDTAGVLRGLEIEADMMIKATKVNGVYDKDPVKFNDAVFIPEASYDEIITKNLRVMDQTAIALAKENGMKLKVVSLYDEDAILRAVLGKNEGTLIS